MSPTWPDHVFTTFATAITSNPARPLTKLWTDLAPFEPNVPHAMRFDNANNKIGIDSYVNGPVLKYVSDERETKCRPQYPSRRRTVTQSWVKLSSVYISPDAQYAVPRGPQSDVTICHTRCTRGLLVSQTLLFFSHGLLGAT